MYCAGRLDRILALVGELEGGRIRFAAFQMQHPLLGMTALKQRIYTNYIRAALPEVVKLVGSTNFLGKLLHCVVIHMLLPALACIREQP